MAIFRVLHFQRAARSTFQTCIINLHDRPNYQLSVSHSRCACDVVSLIGEQRLSLSALRFHVYSWRSLLHAPIVHVSAWSWWCKSLRSTLVIISIRRYLDIDRGFIKRTISWRPYIVRYRARTHVSCVRCSHTAAAASVSDWCGSLCLTFPAVDLSCSALGAWVHRARRTAA